jgi:hypothetical protein
MGTDAPKPRQTDPPIPHTVSRTLSPAALLPFYCRSAGTDTVWPTRCRPVRPASALSYPTSIPLRRPPLLPCAPSDPAPAPLPETRTTATTPMVGASLDLSPPPSPLLDLRDAAVARVPASFGSYCFLPPANSKVFGPGTVAACTLNTYLLLFIRFCCFNHVANEFFGMLQQMFFECCNGIFGSLQQMSLQCCSTTKNLRCCGT